MNTIINTDYFKSGRLAENARIAQGLATKASSEKASIRRVIAEEAYYKNPTKCATCLKTITYKKRKCKYCCSSCAATQNNKNHSHKRKKKARIITCLQCSIEFKGTNYSKKICNRCRIPRKVKKIKYNTDYRHRDSYKCWITCKICQKTVFMAKHRLTCSRECQTIASVKIRSYPNGTRKPTWYFNKFENKEVELDSSWEVKLADWLTENNIEWARPKPIPWIDSKDKSHLYFPDFYLVEKNVYLDPKNKYAMSKDVEKMKVVSEKVTLYYGELTDVKEKVAILYQV
jgi:hypothetical protein